MNRFFCLLSVVFLSAVLILSACSPSSPVATNPSVADTAVPVNTSIPEPTAAIPPTSTNAPLPTISANFSEEFTGSMDAGWAWLGQKSAVADLTSKPGFLHVALQGDNSINRLVRNIASENFQITTHILFTPRSNFQVAGLYIYQDDSTAAQLTRTYCDLKNVCVGNGIYFEGSQSGQYVGPSFGTELPVKDEIYLRIEKSGSIFTGFYSTDGQTWTEIGKHEFSMSNPMVGLITGNSPVIGVNADFDYFTVTALP
jgi:beta-xylosidase